MIDPGNPIFVHSDVGRGLLAVKRKGININSKNICASLLRILISQVGGDSSRVIMPAFNYDYGKSRMYKPYDDPVQVGALPEWVRKNCEYNRSSVPFFSVLSKSATPPKNNQIINPFGGESIFGHLVSYDATIVLLGTDLSSLTFIHHVEEMAGKPSYRYDKHFPGQILIDEVTLYSCDVIMHVRPLGVHLDYDWHRLQAELISEGILQVDEQANDLKYLKARPLIEYWGNKISDDPLYLLDSESRNFFEIETSYGSRRIEIEAYEAK